MAGDLQQRKSSIPVTLEKKRHSLFSSVAPLLALAMLLLFCGCQAASQGAGHPVSRPELNATADGDRDGARLSLFLSLKTPATRGVRMDVSRIEILADTSWLPVSLQPIEIDAATLGGGQLFLGRCLLPANRYQRLRFTISQGSMLHNNGERIFLALDSPTVEVNLPGGGLALEHGDSHSLFITWGEEESLQAPPILRPALSIAPRLKQMVADLAYVACPEIDTVYVIRTDKNWVCDSLSVSGGPTCLAVDTNGSRKRLFILTTREAAIKVVELPTNNIVDSFAIPMTPKPAFMAVNPAGSMAYVLDAEGGYLLRMNLETGTLEARVRLGYQPDYVTYIADQNLLAVASSLSQSVFLIDPATLASTGTISTGQTPRGMAALNDLLYIAESDTNSVSIYDLNNQSLRSRLSVGFAPRRIIQHDNQIYISNHGSDSISILQPEQLSIAREIALNGHPLEMAVEQNRKWLYVGNESIGGLTVVDASINRVAGEILFGATPMGIDVIE